MTSLAKKNCLLSTFNNLYPFLSKLTNMDLKYFLSNLVFLILSCTSIRAKYFQVIDFRFCTVPLIMVFYLPALQCETNFSNMQPLNRFHPKIFYLISHLRPWFVPFRSMYDSCALRHHFVVECTEPSNDNLFSQKTQNSLNSLESYSLPLSQYKLTTLAINKFSLLLTKSVKHFNTSDLKFIKYVTVQWVKSSIKVTKYFFCHRRQSD